MSRPTCWDDRVVQLMVDKMLPQVMSWLNHDGTDKDTREQLVELFADSTGDNGFELARTLADDFYWSPDGDLAEILEFAGCYRGEAWREVIKEWVQETKPVSRLKVGDAVQVKPEKWKDSKVHGEIIRIEVETAQYVVYSPSLGHVREGVGSHGCYYTWEEVEEWNLAKVTT